MNYSSYNRSYGNKYAPAYRGSQQGREAKHQDESRKLCDKLSKNLDKLREMLTNKTEELYEFIESMLSEDKSYYNALFGDTSKTAYRRIHELLISILDQLEYLVSQNTSKVPIELAKAKTIIYHQVARKQFKRGKCKDQKSDGLEFLDRILSILHSELKNKKDPSTVNNLVSSTRTLLDAFVVIVEKNAKS